MNTILVIGDDCLQKTLQHWLTPEGYAIKSSADGRKGFDMFRRATPSAVILDLTLPSASGREVCKSMKEFSPDVPLVVLSATSEVADKVLLFELGADDYVTRPFNPREFLARVEAAIRRSSEHTHNVRTGKS